MDKKEKTPLDNQWTSVPEEPFKGKKSTGKKEKTATDNQWTSTIKNNIDDK